MTWVESIQELYLTELSSLGESNGTMGTFQVLILVIGTQRMDGVTIQQKGTLKVLQILMIIRQVPLLTIVQVPLNSQEMMEVLTV